MPGTEQIARQGDRNLHLYNVLGDVAIQVSEPNSSCAAFRFPLDRKAINDLIKQMREARDYAYGVDQ